MRFTKNLVVSNQHAELFSQLNAAVNGCLEKRKDGETMTPALVGVLLIRLGIRYLLTTSPPEEVIRTMFEAALGSEKAHRVATPGKIGVG